MKKLLLCALLCSLIPLRADDATPAQPDEKAAAIQLDQDMATLVRADDSSAASWDAIDARLENYQKQYGVTPKTTNNIIMLRRKELSVLKRLAPARYDALVQKLALDPDRNISALVTKIAELKSKPVDLKFTAVDGSEVDLAKMRGKVVLIDFWATWCGPCREEVPNVVAAYHKYHDHGFEVVGVSLDQDKQALLDFTKKNDMAWPQYFDGKGWHNAISSGYGINSIPAMWLVGKDGMLITTNAREDLAGQVEKALAAK